MSPRVSPHLPYAQRATRSRARSRRVEPMPVFLHLPPRHQGRANATGEPADGVPDGAALLFGLELEGLGAAAIETRLEAAARLYLLLPRVVRQGYKLSCAWQVRCLPTGHRSSKHAPSLTFALLVRVTAVWGQSAGDLRDAAKETYLDIAHLLSTAMPHAWFAPVGDLDRLRDLRALRRTEDLVEFRPNWVSVADSLALPTPLSGIADLALLIDELRAEGCGALLSLAFEPVGSIASMGALLALAGSMHDDPVGALLKLESERDAHHAEPDERSGATHDRRRRQSFLASWLARKLPPLRDAYRVGLRVAAEQQLSAGFLAVAAAEFAGEGRLMAGHTWRLSSRILSPDTRPQRPRSVRHTDRRQRFTNAPCQAEWAIARDNLERLEFEPWGDPVGARGRINLPDQSLDLTPAALAQVVSCEELAQLLALPLTASWLPPHIASLPIAAESLPTKGAFLGTTRSGRQRVRVNWPESSRILQSILNGATGTGKSTLIANIALEDIRAGHAIIMLDPHGTLIDALLPRIPAERANDVLLLDVEDTARPLGYNPLDLKTEEERSRFVTSYIAQLERMFDPNKLGFVGPVAMQGLRAALQGIMSIEGYGGTLIEVARLFDEEDFLRKMIPRMRDRNAAAYFKRFLTTRTDEQSGYALHISSKLSEWAADPIMRRIVGQSTSSFSFSEAMNSRKIVLLRLASGFLGSEKSTFLGHTFLPAIFQASLERASMPAGELPFTSIFIDEAPVFASEVIASMLAQSRKGNLAVHLASQHLSQFLPTIRDAILANAGNIFAFRAGLPDAAILERIFGSSAVDERYLTHLPLGQVVTRIMLTSGEPSQPFLLETDPLRGTPDDAVAQAIRDYSRMTYGRPREEVDRQIEERDNPPRRDAPPEPTGGLGELFRGLTQ